MKSITQFIEEHREDLTAQVVMIMGTPGCGKTYWMTHNGVRFMKDQGFKIFPKELDVDHTLKYFQLIDFPNFCHRLINYRNTTITDKNGADVNNNDRAWKTFVDNEQKRYAKLNMSNGGLESNIPQINKIEYADVAPWFTRYDNAKEDMKESVFNEFCKFMQKKYFDKVFASDFSVRDEAKVEYKKNLQDKLSKHVDVFAAISGAKVKHIKEIADLCKENGATCRIVYLNGSVDKAVMQDAKRERSGGETFVRDYAEKIDKVWSQLIDPSSPNYFKNIGIYNIYELHDMKAEDNFSFPAWKLVETYK